VVGRMGRMLQTSVCVGGVYNVCLQLSGLGHRAQDE